MKNRANRFNFRSSTVTALAFAATVFIHGCDRSDEGPSPSRSAAPLQAAGPTLDVREVESPAGVDSREPELFTTPDNRVILSWVEKTGEKRYALRFAARDAEGWSEARTAAEGEKWFINWADFPSVVALPGGSLASHRLVKSGPGTYAYDVQVSLSKDGGKSWGAPVVPHSDKTLTEHGFVSLIPLADGRVGAVWLDGRNLKDVREGEEEKGPLPVSMTLRYAAVDAEGRVSDEALLDGSALVCWMSGTADGGAIKTRQFSHDGALGPVTVVARTDMSRSSGFPRMARLGEDIYFAWTEFAKPARVRTAMAKLRSGE